MLHQAFENISAAHVLHNEVDSVNILENNDNIACYLIRWRLGKAYETDVSSTDNQPMYVKNAFVNLCSIGRIKRY